MNLLDPMIQENPKIRIAVIDKDEPGGICLARGCIPSKLLLYPAEIVRTAEKGRDIGVSAEVKVDFPKIMKRMRTLIDADISSIREGLSTSPNVDYYHSSAEFVAPYTLQVADETMTAKQFFLCTGSRTTIPPIKNIEKVGYLTSDSVLGLTSLPASIVIIGGGYIAAEYGHFFSSMGSRVSIIGRNKQFLPGYEPEVALVARRELERHMTIATNCEVVEIGEKDRMKVLTTRNRESGETSEVEAEQVLIAVGREPLNDILHPERAGIKTGAGGWIAVDEHLQTNQPNIWALGDADGRYLLQARRELRVAGGLLQRGAEEEAEDGLPRSAHAVFTYPEIAGVGQTEKEAIEELGEDDVAIGFYLYENTAKGEAMDAKEYFVKAVVQRSTMKILGAQIVGPQASVLVQEIVNVMYTPDRHASVVNRAMHIHPALSEVVEHAFLSLVPPRDYHHMLGHLGLETGEDYHHHE